MLSIRWTRPHAILARWSATAILVTVCGMAGAVSAWADASFDCVITPALKLKLAAPIAGVLSQVTVDRGAAVAKGQLLARLDDSIDEAALTLDRSRANFEAVIASRRSRVDFLKRKQDRLAQLASRGDATPTQLDEVATDFQLATGDLMEAEKNQELAKLEAAKQSEVVRQHEVRSPIDGIVVERNLYAGEYAFEQSPILTIAQIDPLKVEVYLPTALYRSVSLGMPVDVRPGAPFDQDYPAKVEVVDSVSDAQSGTFGVRLVLENPGGTLPAGLRCRATFSKIQAP